MRSGHLIGPIIVAIGLVVAAIVFAVVGTLLETADGSIEMRLDRGEAELSRLRGEIAAVHSDLEQAREDIRQLNEEVALRAAAPRSAQSVFLEAREQLVVPNLIDDHDAVEGTEAKTEIMQLAGSQFNIGITQPRNSIMLEILGNPRDSYSSTCQPVTNPRLSALLETRQVGPIRVTMIRPALDSLERIVTRLKQEEPDIYEALGTAGALCARLIRGSSRSISNHSWGTAIDLKIEGKLDGFGDGGTQAALVILGLMFNEEGWFWGATYRREDSMHFEVGVETLRAWKAAGLI